ncbi:transposase [Butyricimonas hominis]|uniref:transposase n=1 Tax=Butyricimonas TaxID=574697 RepID=UPI00351766C8
MKNSLNLLTIACFIYALFAKIVNVEEKTILNYFDNRSTNAAAESFNAKIKEFRRVFRGIRDIKFFLFRLCKIYA